MSLRASFGSCFVAAALLAAAGSASAQSPSIARATNASTSMDGCVRYVANQAIVVRCAAPERQILADHGSAYDAQGNAVDRHGDVLAVPDGRGSAREVFADERRSLR